MSKKYNVALPSPQNYLSGHYHYWVEPVEVRGEEDPSFPIGWMYCGVVDLDIEVDQKAIREHALQQLDEQEKAARAKLEIELQAIEEARNRLNSIEYMSWN